MAYMTIQDSLLDDRLETIMMRTQEAHEQNISAPWVGRLCEYRVSVVRSGGAT